jgi:hypothetical protein
VAIVTESSQDPAAVLHPTPCVGGGGNDLKRRLGCGFTGDAAAAASASSAGNAVCFVICDRAGGRAQKGAEQAGELRASRGRHSVGLVLVGGGEGLGFWACYL